MATIDKELLTGNVNLKLEVYGTPEECDHPVRFKVTITPERAAQIRRMAAIVREHQHDGLELWSIRAWDAFGDWLNGTWDTDDGELALDEANPERMECNAIEVSDDNFHYIAYVKNCDILCETDYVKISDLHTTEGGDRDERLRVTD